MRKIADMGASALDHIAIRLNERIELGLQWLDLVGKLSLQMLRIARADRGEVLANGAQWQQTEPHLEERRHHKPNTENGQGEDQHGREGGEIWSDYYAIPKGAPHREAAYALINFLLDPAVNAKEVLFHGYPSADAHTNALLPESLLNDPILYPAAELLTPLEFGAAVTLTDPNRAELMARFKSA